MSDTETTTADESTASDGTTDTGQSDSAKGDETLGDAGKAALTAERTARKDAERSAKEAADKLATLEAEVKRLQRANAAVKGTDLDAIKAEIAAEYDSKVLASEIKAEAKGKVVDAPEVAARYPEYFKDLTAGDDKAIADAVTKLLTDKPYLAVESSSDPQWGDVGGGNRKTSKPEPSNPQERMARAYGSK
ncbi:hypothetical protein ABZY06_33970 [Streptomyces sp. NPDC006540]|uniref:hypothetical protein n=1 Tax=Streptomyces sp. NPDC006540 TaxID=3155353 RepID=UPI0033BA8A49